MRGEVVVECRVGLVDIQDDPLRRGLAGAVGVRAFVEALGQKPALVFGPSCYYRIT